MDIVHDQQIEEKINFTEDGVSAYFYKLCNTQGDINEHLPVINKYAKDCDIVVEMGVRTVNSTWSFIAAKPKKIISIDIKHPGEWGAYDNFTNAATACKELGICFYFIQGDSRLIDIPDHDLLFIDTLHDYDVLKEELRVQSLKTKKYIIMHDTVSFGFCDESTYSGRGLNQAIYEFLLENRQWRIKEIFYNNNGLTILEKVTT